MLILFIFSLLSIGTLSASCNECWDNHNTCSWNTEETAWNECSKVYDDGSGIAPFDRDCIEEKAAESAECYANAGCFEAGNDECWWKMWELGCSDYECEAYTICTERYYAEANCDGELEECEQNCEHDEYYTDYNWYDSYDSEYSCDCGDGIYYDCWCGDNYYDSFGYEYSDHYDEYNSDQYGYDDNYNDFYYGDDGECYCDCGDIEHDDPWQYSYDEIPDCIKDGCNDALLTCANEENCVYAIEGVVDECGNSQNIEECIENIFIYNSDDTQSQHRLNSFCNHDEQCSIDFKNLGECVINNECHRGHNKLMIKKKLKKLVSGLKHLRKQKLSLKLKKSKKERIKSAKLSLQKRRMNRHKKPKRNNIQKRRVVNKSRKIRPRSLRRNNKQKRISKRIKPRSLRRQKRRKLVSKKRNSPRSLKRRQKRRSRRVKPKSLKKRKERRGKPLKSRRKLQGYDYSDYGDDYYGYNYYGDWGYDYDSNDYGWHHYGDDYYDSDYNDWQYSDNYNYGDWHNNDYGYDNYGDYGWHDYYGDDEHHYYDSDMDGYHYYGHYYDHYGDDVDGYNNYDDWRYDDYHYVSDMYGYNDDGYDSYEWYNYYGNDDSFGDDNYGWNDYYNYDGQDIYGYDYYGDDDSWQYTYDEVPECVKDGCNSQLLTCADEENCVYAIESVVEHCCNTFNVSQCIEDTFIYNDDDNYSDDRLKSLCGGDNKCYYDFKNLGECVINNQCHKGHNKRMIKNKLKQIVKGLKIIKRRTRKHTLSKKRKLNRHKQSKRNNRRKLISLQQRRRRRKGRRARTDRRR